MTAGGPRVAISLNWIGHGELHRGFAERNLDVRAALSVAGRIGKCFLKDSVGGLIRGASELLPCSGRLERYLEPGGDMARDKRLQRGKPYRSVDDLVG